MASVFPEPCSTLTMDHLRKTLRTTRILSIGPRAPAPQIITSGLTVTESLPAVSRWCRFVRWLEDTNDKAGLITPWARMPRVRVVPDRNVYRIGDQYVMHPAMHAELRGKYGER